MITDAGHGYVKGLFAPSGANSLAAELVAAELGTLMGLDVPPFAVIRSSEIDAPMQDCNSHMGPPFFFSLEVVGAVPSDGSDEFLKRLARPDDIAKLVVFDTWIRNSDRCSAVYGDLSYNRDNLLFGPVGRRRYSLHPIDHANCFVTSSPEFEDELAGDEAMADEEVYGLFPEFRPYLTPRSVALAVDAMLAVPAGTVADIVNSIPTQWGVTAPVRHRLRDVIMARAERVAAFLPGKLVDDPQMPLPGGENG